MPVTTTDVITNAVSGVDTSKNGSAVVSCFPTGRFKSTTPVVSGVNYETMEARLENRFDDVTYYTTGPNDLLGA